ncbi:MAG: FtsX-like permease family protein [Acidobacteriota bacterium]
MRFLLRTLSLSYLRLHLAKTLLTLLGVAVGVSTLVSIQSAETALMRGLRNTVDRIAGKAQLQVVCDGGVPEEAQDRIRDVPGVVAVAPVIEQVVVAEGPASGSLLILGVDLLGDREMREYGFEGDDADIDDPLLFLAQPDSIALCTTYARRAGLRKDSSLTLRISNGTKRVVVRGLMRPSGFTEAFAGNVAVTDVYAAQLLFGRGRRFDRVEVRLEEGVSLEEGTRRLAAALGPGYRMETPERRSAQMERIIENFVAGFNVTSTFALAIGVFLIFNAFTVAVTRRRRDIGILRALGATPRQVQALFLMEAAILGVAGGVVGLAGGAAASGLSLRAMSDPVQNIYGLTEGASTHVDGRLVVLALTLGIVASLLGAWAPARNASRIDPVEALAKGTYTARVPPPTLARLAVGAAAIAGAILVAVFRPLTGLPMVVSVILLGFLSALLLVGPVSSRLVRLLAPAISRLSPVSGRLASDSLLGNPRRTAGTVIAIAASLAFVLGLSGYMDATRLALYRWIDNVITSDIYVRSSAKLLRPDFRFGPELRDELLAIPGVRAVESFRSERVSFRGVDIVVASIEIEGMMRRTKHEFLEGNAETFERGLVREGKCAVSDNFYGLYRLGMGDVLELPTPNGLVGLPIAAVFTDYTSDRGTVFIDRATFTKLWNDDRVDTYDVNLLAGARRDQVMRDIRRRIGDRFPALISTREEFTAEIRRALDAFFALTRTTLMTAILVAFIGIVTSLLISVMERTREFGILKSLGAVRQQVRRSVVIEALVVGLTGLIIAVPMGQLLTVFNTTTVAETFAGWRMPVRYPFTALIQILVALPLVSAAAAWLPVRQALSIKVTEAISYE